MYNIAEEMENFK